MFDDLKDYVEFVLRLLADSHEARVLAKVAYNLTIGDLVLGADFASVDGVHPVPENTRGRGVSPRDVDQ